MLSAQAKLRRRTRILLSGARARDDSGNLVAVLILVVVLTATIAILIAGIIPSFSTASTTQYGEQSVAQANSGLSDALLQLDQMGDQVSNFCLGQAPASAMQAAGLSSCTNQSSASPLSDAPGVVYYLASAVAGPLPLGVTNEVEITSEAIVDGQKRIAKDLVYREADQFAMFAVGDLTINGNSTGAAIGAAGGDPLQLTSVNQIDFGVGPSGALTCTGGTPSDTTWIGEDGATVSCGNNEQETTTLSPLDPSFCTGDEVSKAFHPCVDTGAQSTDSCPNCVTTGSPGSTYCPLPGIGFKTQPTVSSAPTPPSNAVFDCTSASPGGAVFIGDTTGTSPANAACASASGKIKTVTTPTVTMPDDFTTLPAGNYYLDSNNVSFCGIPPTVLPNGPVNIYILPQGCGTSGQCAFDTPSQSNYTCPVGGASSPQLTVDGYVNVTDPPTGYTGPTLSTADDTVEAGLPSDFGIFWGGDSAINFPKTMVLDSNFYAPGAQLVLDGSSYTTIGSLVLNCFSMQGGPTMDFTYAQHPAQYLQGWTSSQYSITP